MKPALTRAFFNAAVARVSEVFGIDKADLLSHYRPNHVVRARLALYHVLRHHRDDSLPNFVRKDRSTVIHGRRRLWGWMQTDPQLAELVKQSDTINT